MTSIHLERKDIPQQILNAFPDYKGKHFKVELTESVYLDGAYWDGGSKCTYVAIELSTGMRAETQPMIGNPPQFGGSRNIPKWTEHGALECREGILHCKRHAR